MEENTHSPLIYLVVIFKNLAWLLTLLFGSAINYIIEIFPSWRSSLEDFKEIGGAVIVILVIIKLLFEITKLSKK